MNLEENNWLKFKNSGKIADYLNYVNSCKGSENVGGKRNPLHDRSACNTGNERGGERPPRDTFQQGARYY